MTRRKKKRQPQSSTETGAISPAGNPEEEPVGLDTTPEEIKEPSLSSAPEPSVPEFAPQITVEESEQHEPGPSLLESVEEEAAAPSAPVVEGFFAKLARWWHEFIANCRRFFAELVRGGRPEGAAEAEATPPPIATNEMAFPNGSPSEPELGTPANLPADEVAESPAPPAVGLRSLPEPTPSTSRVDTVLRDLYQRRMEAELEAVQDELEKGKQEAALRVQQLGAERDRSRLEASQERAKRQEIEARTRPLQEALDSLERRLEEERLTAQARIRELEALVNSAGTPENSPEWPLRVRALEAQLDVAQHDLTAAQEQSEQQIRGLQAERQDLEGRLAAREHGLNALLSQANQAQERATHLEALLQRAQERVGQLEVELAERNAQVEQLRVAHPSAPAAPVSETTGAAALAAPSEKSSRLPPDVAANFYQQAVSILTVMMATADLLAMNPRLDPSLRETAREIRTQGQKVVGLIKSITYPEKAKEGEAGST